MKIKRKLLSLDYYLYKNSLHTDRLHRNESQNNWKIGKKKNRKYRFNDHNLNSIRSIYTKNDFFWVDSFEVFSFRFRENKVGNFIAWSFNMLDRPSPGLAFHVGTHNKRYIHQVREPFFDRSIESTNNADASAGIVEQNGNVLLNYG